MRSLLETVVFGLLMKKDLAVVLLVITHGAGTAVAFYLLHRRFKYVTMNQIRDAVYFGDKHRKILKFKRRIPSEKELKLIKREVMIYLAGPIAVGIHFGRSEYEDVKLFLDLKSKLNEKERWIGESLWRWDFEDTKLLMYAPWNWHAIDALADELQKMEKIRYKCKLWGSHLQLSIDFFLKDPGSEF
jgi:hypothetical protein